MNKFIKTEVDFSILVIVTYIDNANFVVNVRFNNTGLTSAYNTNINFYS